MKNPKSEIRNPKEIRSPNVEGMPGESEFWDWAEEAAGTQALREDGNVPPPPPRDLLERTALFAEVVIRFAKKVPRGPTTNRLIDQVVGASSSVAANFCEADDAVSGKDFKKSIGTCRKESKETMLFLRLIATAEESLAPEARQLWRGQGAESHLWCHLEKVTMKKPRTSFGVRISGFGILSGFELRASDFTPLP